MIAAARDAGVVCSVPWTCFHLHSGSHAWPSIAASVPTPLRKEVQAPQSPEPGPAESPPLPDPAQCHLLSASLWDEWDRVPPWRCSLWGDSHKGMKQGLQGPSEAP